MKKTNFNNLNLSIAVTSILAELSDLSSGSSAGPLLVLLMGPVQTFTQLTTLVQPTYISIIQP